MRCSDKRKASISRTYESMKYLQRSEEEAFSDLEKRKIENKENFSLYGYTLIEIRKGSNKQVLVKYNNEGEINGTCCTYCFTHIGRSPFYSNAYVYPVCNKCLVDIWFIENFNKKDKSMKKNNKKNTVSEINLDWVKFEESVRNGTAKLVALAEQHNSYPADIRALITKKYAGTIEFRTGRNGGIYFAATVTSSSSPSPVRVV